MKKIIFVLFLLVSVSVSSQEFKPKVAFDYFPTKRGCTFKVGDEIAFLGDYRTRIGLDFTGKVPINKNFVRDLTYTAFTDIHTYMDFANRGVQFSPNLVNFYIGVNLSYKKFKLEYKHLCVHPTKVDGRKSLDVYGGYDMVSLSYGY